jgi:hypothetical protein
MTPIWHEPPSAGFVRAVPLAADRACVDVVATSVDEDWAHPAEVRHDTRMAAAKVRSMV